MKKPIFVILALGLLFSVQAQNKKSLKKEVIGSLETQKNALIYISDTICVAA